MTKRREKESGGAELRIELSGNKVTVTHADGSILFRGNAYNGYWENLWKAIEEPLFVTTKYRAKK